MYGLCPFGVRTCVGSCIFEDRCLAIPQVKYNLPRFSYMLLLLGEQETKFNSMNNKEELRPCEFTLEGHDMMGHVKPGMFDYDNDEERQKATRLRIGKFHCWETELQPQTAEGLVTSCGIVEDTADGQVYRVNPENIRFTDC